jgi:uncharacterized protein
LTRWWLRCHNRVGWLGPASEHAGQLEAARYLLEHGADLNWVGWDDLTSLDVAVQAGHKELADWLRDQGAKPASDLSS